MTIQILKKKLRSHISKVIISKEFHVGVTKIIIVKK